MQQQHSSNETKPYQTNQTKPGNNNAHRIELNFRIESEIRGEEERTNERTEMHFE